MDHNEIENLAAEVREATGQTIPPIDVMKIAQQEGIILAPDDYGEDFDGRIEFHSTKGKFILYYSEVDPRHPETRNRFSIAHELGHYYIPTHRELLLNGQSHFSQAGFICENKLEREADIFSASLILPKSTLDDLTFKRNFLTLRDILKLSVQWQVSATCAAIRYAETTSDCCAVLVSADGEVCYYIPSEDASYRGFNWLGNKSIPRSSATYDASRQQGSNEISEKATDTETWFSERRISCDLWEEAFPLGYTGLVLTMLAFQID